MAYEDVRTQLATVLATVEIDSPIAETIAKVYTDPPASLEDPPCFVLYGSAGGREWMLGGGAVEEEHTERVRLLIRDPDADRAGALRRAYREAALTALVNQSGLGDNGVLTRLAWEEPAAFPAYGDHVTGMDFLVTFQVTTP